MKGHISNCTGVQGLRGGAIIPRYWKWIFQQCISQIYSRFKKGGALYPWPHALRHRSEGQDRSGWNGERLHYLYSFLPLFLSIKFTYHEVQTWKLTLLTMDTIKSTSQRFKMPGCARITGSLHMTIHMKVLIETLKALSSDLCWCSWNIFSTQDNTVVVITHEKSDDAFSWKGESL